MVDGLLPELAISTVIVFLILTQWKPVETTLEEMSQFTGTLAQQKPWFKSDIVSLSKTGNHLKTTLQALFKICFVVVCNFLGPSCLFLVLEVQLFFHWTVHSIIICPESYSSLPFFKLQDIWQITQILKFHKLKCIEELPHLQEILFLNTS